MLMIKTKNIFDSQNISLSPPSPLASCFCFHSSRILLYSPNKPIKTCYPPVNARGLELTILLNKKFLSLTLQLNIQKILQLPSGQLFKILKSVLLEQDSEIDITTLDLFHLRTKKCSQFRCYLLEILFHLQKG